jgi:hypothetical protein|tara:strand:+ start:192 stop:491 length:300 start_codon:yes stop_codon:yes gene_type:complete
MLQFDSNNFDALELEVQERAEEVSLFTVRAVCDGLEANVDVVNVGFMKNLNMDITCERQGFLEALALNIKRCEEAEEYELCAKARKWIKILQDEEEQAT